MRYATAMNATARSPLKWAVVVLGLLGLSGCVTYHQPRYGGDGVYFDQYRPQPRTLLVVDPFFYPYWSLDHFYFSRYNAPHYWGHPYRYGWGYPHFGYVHYYGYQVPAPLQRDHLVDARLIAIDARTRARYSGPEASDARLVLPTNLSQAALRSQRQGQTSSARPSRVHSPGRETLRSPVQTRSRTTSIQRPATVRQAPRSRPAATRVAPRSTRPASGVRDRSSRQVDPR
jgi:hypothetical protein